jgi:GTP1/Obg family GTP-binding protein
MVIAKQTYKLPSNRECPRCGVDKKNTQQQTVKQTEQTLLRFPSKNDIFGAFDADYIDILTDEEKEDLRVKLGLVELTKEKYSKLRENFFNNLTTGKYQNYENNLIKDWHVTASKKAFKAINDKELKDIILERPSKYLQTGVFFQKKK